jgi:O-acetyl-ADP-ribose deacetylase
LFTLDYRGAKISLLQGNIVLQDTEAIVNAANSSLTGGGGVDGAIHRAGGPAILRECPEIRRKEWPSGLRVGEAVITTGGNLRAKYVIHTVGPVWNGGGKGEEERLSACHENSLRVAFRKNVRSISFPAISTGAFGYPVTLASKTALNSVRKTLVDSPAKQKLEEVRLVLFTSGDYDTYVSAAKSIFG